MPLVARRAPDVMSHLTSGRTLARSAVWNLLGQVVPVLVALVAVPHLVRGLGIDRFGVLTLAWTVVGYFTLFDLGLGWSLTRIVSEKLAAGREEEVPALVWTSLALLSALGVLGAAVIWAIAPWLVSAVLHVPAALEAEALLSVRLLAVAIPVVIGTAGLHGLLAAHQRFAAINAIRVPLMVASYLGPLLALPYSNELPLVVAILVGSRALGCAASLAVCLRIVPALRKRIVVRTGLVRSLLGYGGWITVTNVVGPVMVSLDRFLIGALLTMAAVAYYSTPYDLVSRVWLASSPAVAVLFPAFAASFSVEPERTRRLFAHGVRYVFVVLFPATLVLATFAREGLRLWLGDEFAAHGAPVLQLLAVGAFVNGMAHVALALVQGVGRPSWAARLHLAELPLYLGAAWLLIVTMGITGAAIAWLARAFLDALALFLKSANLLRLPGASVRRAAWIAVASLTALVIGIVLPAGPLKLVFLAIVLALHAAWSWRFVVHPGQGAFAALLELPRRG